jgi:hypothetical protein
MVKCGRRCAWCQGHPGRVPEPSPVGGAVCVSVCVCVCRGAGWEIEACHQQKILMHSCKQAPLQAEPAAKVTQQGLSNDETSGCDGLKRSQAQQDVPSMSRVPHWPHQICRRARESGQWHSSLWPRCGGHVGIGNVLLRQNCGSLPPKVDEQPTPIISAPFLQGRAGAQANRPFYSWPAKRLS